MRYLIVFLVVANSFCLNLQSQVLFQPSNLNFENGPNGMVPDSWNHSRNLEKDGLIVETSDFRPAEGRFSVTLYNPTKMTNREEIERTTLPTYQVLDAIPYRGKTVKLSAMARLDSVPFFAKGELWAIGRQTKDSITIDTYQKDGITDSSWQSYSITFFVPEQTNELRIGILLKGGGKLYADNFKIEIVQPKGAINEPAKKYSDIEIENLKAFANIYGYLNYFNPATNLPSSRNDELTFWALANTEKATNYKELFEALNHYTKLISPSSKLSDKESEPSSYTRPKGSLDYVAYAKKFIGGPVDGSDGMFSASTVNIFATARNREASVVQMVEALKFKGKTAKISVSIKVEQASAGANAQIWARADRLGSREFVAATTSDNPAMSSAWKRYELMLELPQDIYTIKLALVFLGEGKAYFDDVKIDILENGKKVDIINFPNNSFEDVSDSSKVPNFWLVDPAVYQAGYYVRSDDKESSKGKYSLVLESEQENRVEFPKIGEVYTQKISKNIFLHIPYLIYGNEKSILPLPTEDSIYTKGKPKGFDPTPEDRLTRVASVIKLWNSIKHFGPSKNDYSTLDSALHFSLTKAGMDKTPLDFMETLKSLLLLTGDARAMVWYPEVDLNYSFPFIFRQVNGKVLVTTVKDFSLGINRGDQILKINDENISELMQKRVELSPGNNITYKTSKALVELRAGAEGSKAKISFQRNDGTSYEVIATRSALLNSIYERRPVALHDIDSGMAYIDLTMLTDDLIKEYIDAISQRNGFIFDLRGFSQVSEYFMSMLAKDSILNAKWEIPVYTYPDKEHKSSLNFGGHYIATDGKLSGKKNIFLIDDRTSGYAEALASIAKTNKLGTLIGSPTSGYASESIVFRLFGQIGVSFAGLKVISPDNTIIFGNSILPDIELNYELNQSDDSYDNYIFKALEMLKND